MSNVRKEIETIDADKILTAVDSGKVFMLNYNTTLAITLPAPTTAGLIFKFIVKDVTDTKTITSTSTNISGVICQKSTSTDTGPATDSVVAVSTATNILFGTTAELGDTVELISDGTNYYVTGFSRINGAITVS